jgi:phosphopantetheinyl transferase (holo-ACP synthase)
MILTVPGGAPRLRTSGAASDRLREMGITATHVSITHTREHAVALVVLEARNPR